MTGGFDADPTVADATNVLVIAPALDDAHDHLCRDVLLAEGSVPERVVGVTIATSPEERFSTWQTELGTEPSYSFVSANGVARSTAVESGDAGAPGGPAVEYVDGVRPLEVFGKTIADAIDAGAETAVCFDSITDLLEVVDREAAFRFLHVLASRVRTTGARAHFHIDGTAHDTETIALFSRLFDVVVEPSDGDRSPRG